MVEIDVQPNKNEFLLCSFLIAHELLDRLPPLGLDAIDLRKRTRQHFSGGKRLEVSLPHSSKAASFVLMFNDAPNYTFRPEFKETEIDQDSKSFREGLKYADPLKRFYSETDFEDFYKSILPDFKELCLTLKRNLGAVPLEQVLNDAWEIERRSNLCVLPMPLFSNHSGCGLHFAGVDYPLIGPPYDRSCLHLIGHEASHPRAKQVLAPLEKEIAASARLLQIVQKNPMYPTNYNCWSTCFEEHFIRAMQAGFIDPRLIRGSTESKLNHELIDNGMVFIQDFYDEIVIQKASGQGSLQEAGLNILRRLDIRY